MERAEMFLNYCNETLFNEKHKAEMEKEYHFRGPTNGLKMGFLENSPFGLIERVYAAKRTKRMDFVHMEVAVIPLDKELPILSRNCYFNYYGLAQGFFVYGYDKKGKPVDYYGNSFPYMEVHDYSALDNERIYRIEFYDYDEIEQLAPELKYSHYMRNNGRITLRSYIELWKKYPVCEMLMKCGIYRWFEESKLEKLSKNKEFQKWTFRWHKEISADCMSFSYAHNSFKKNPARNPLDYVEEIKKNKQIADFFRYEDKELLKYLIKFTSKARMFEYVKQNGIGIRSYFDYLRACRWLDLNFKDTKVLFPKDFETYHDDYTKQYDEYMKEQEKIAEQEKSLKIKEAAEKLSYLKFEKDGLFVVIPESKEDFIAEGKQQNNCVGRMHYDDKVIAGTSAVCFIRKIEEPEKSFITAEVKLPELKILQFYGFNNKRYEETKEFEDAWMKQARKNKKKLEKEVV